MYKVLITKIVENVVDTFNMKIQDINMAIAVNDENNLTTSTIRDLSQRFKHINIVTNNMKPFKKIEEEVFNEYGVVLTVTNNKRKSLLKSDILLNIDFPEELLNKYSIKETALIISGEEKVKIHKKRFNGKVIQDYSIKLEPNSQIYEDLNKQKYKGFDIKDIAECYIINHPEQVNNIIICI